MQRRERESRDGINHSGQTAGLNASGGQTSSFHTHWMLHASLPSEAGRTAGKQEARFRSLTAKAPPMHSGSDAQRMALPKSGLSSLPCGSAAGASCLNSKAGGCSSFCNYAFCMAALNWNTTHNIRDRPWCVLCQVEILSSQNRPL